MSLDAIKNKSFWFTRAKVKNSNRWPLGSSRYIEDLSNTITKTYYGESFQNAKVSSEAQFRRVFKDSAILQGLKTNFTPEQREAYSLLSNGFTTNAILGKLRDSEIKQAVIKPKLAVASNISTPNTDEWAEIASDEPVFTPREFVNLANAERIANHPEILIENQTPPVYSDKIGYLPPKLENNRDFNAYAHMQKIENFDKFVQNLEKNAGIRIRPDDTLEESQTKLVRRRFFGPLNTIRKVFTTYSVSTGMKKTGWPARYTLSYPSNNTQSEQVYGILKRLSQISVEDYAEITEKTISLIEPTNLPSLEEFGQDKDLIMKAASCLVASELSHMIGLNKDDARIFSDTFKLEATEYISQLSNQNSDKLMPLIADYYAIATSNFVQDFNVSIKQYAESKGIASDNAHNIYDVLYARQAPQVTVTASASQSNDFGRILQDFLNHRQSQQGQRQSGQSGNSQSQPSQNNNGQQDTSVEQEIFEWQAEVARQIMAQQENQQQSGQNNNGQQDNSVEQEISKWQAEVARQIMAQSNSQQQPGISQQQQQPGAGQQQSSQSTGLIPPTTLTREEAQEYVMPEKGSRMVESIKTPDGDRNAQINPELRSYIRVVKDGRLVPIDENTNVYFIGSDVSNLQAVVNGVVQDVVENRNYQLINATTNAEVEPNDDFVLTDDIRVVPRQVSNRRRDELGADLRNDIVLTEGDIVIDRAASLFSINNEYQSNVNYYSNTSSEVQMQINAGDSSRAVDVYTPYIPVNEHGVIHPDPTPPERSQPDDSVDPKELFGEQIVGRPRDNTYIGIVGVNKDGVISPIPLKPYNFNQVEQSQVNAIEQEITAQQTQIANNIKDFNAMANTTETTAPRPSVQPSTQPAQNGNSASGAQRNPNWHRDRALAELQRGRKPLPSKEDLELKQTPANNTGAGVNDEEFKKLRADARRKKQQKRSLAELRRNREKETQKSGDYQVMTEEEKIAEADRRAAEMGKRLYESQRQINGGKTLEELDKEISERAKAIYYGTYNPSQVQDDAVQEETMDNTANTNDDFHTRYEDLSPEMQRLIYPERYYSKEELQKRLYGEQRIDTSAQENIQENVAIEQEETFDTQNVEQNQVDNRQFIEMAGRSPSEFGTDPIYDNNSVKKCQDMVAKVVQDYTMTCCDLWGESSRAKNSIESKEESEVYRTRARTGGVVKSIMDDVINGRPNKRFNGKNAPVEFAVAKQLLSVGHDIVNQIDQYRKDNPNVFKDKAFTSAAFKGYLISLAKSQLPTSAYYDVDKQKKILSDNRLAEYGKQVVEESIRQEVYRILDTGSNAVQAKKEQDIQNGADKKQVAKVEAEKDEVLDNVKKGESKGNAQHTLDEYGEQMQ